MSRGRIKVGCPCVLEDRRGSGKNVSIPAGERARGRTKERPDRLRMSSTEPNKVIYSMMGVSKSYDKKVVLKNIWLSYFYGAKIGGLGLNGSGKSSLLKILAGVDKNFQGQISLAPGFTTGFLEQEPQLDPNKTVKQVVEEG